jgi:outer membrane murein-binding lipoprotein Lpp
MNYGKIILMLITVMMISVFMLTGCYSQNEVLEAEIETLENEIEVLEVEKTKLESEIVEVKTEKGLESYILTINIKQSHFTLDIGQHIKDEMNDISIEIPVDKEFYDAVEVGDIINDEFRWGSLILKGSIGSWDVTVENKEIR